MCIFYTIWSSSLLIIPYIISVLIDVLFFCPYVDLAEESFEILYIVCWLDVLSSLYRRHRNPSYTVLYVLVFLLLS